MCIRGAVFFVIVRISVSSGYSTAFLLSFVGALFFALLSLPLQPFYIYVYRSKENA